jgi:hypothetical protein
MEYKAIAISNTLTTMEELLKKFCHIENNNEIMINHDYLKKIKQYTSETTILNYMIFIIDSVLNKYTTFIANVYIDNLTLLDIDKNKYFIQNMCNILKEKFPDKLEICYVHNTPYLFAQLYSLLKVWVDKKTLAKIKLRN